MSRAAGCRAHSNNKRELFRLRERGRAIHSVRLPVALHVRLIGRRREFRREYRRDRPRAIEVPRRGTLACRHMFEAAHFWPLAGFRKIVAVLPGRPPIRAHDNARLVIVDDERLDARAIRVQTVARDRASRGNRRHSLQRNSRPRLQSQQSRKHASTQLQSLKMDLEHIAMP